MKELKPAVRSELHDAAERALLSSKTGMAATLVVAQGRLVTFREAATLLTVSLNTARGIFATGKIPVINIGPRSKRVRLQAVLDYLEANTVKPR